MKITISDLSSNMKEVEAADMTEVIEHITAAYGVPFEHLNIFDDENHLTESKIIFDRYTLHDGTDITYIVNEKPVRVPPNIAAIYSANDRAPEETYAIYGELGEWDVSFVTDMSSLFFGCNFSDYDISNWDVSSVTNMNNMFSYNYRFNQPIGDWDVSNVTNMGSMFLNACQFNQPIGTWDVSNVTDMSRMFYCTDKFNQPIGDWDVSNVTDMTAMFLRTESFNQPIGTLGRVKRYKYECNV